MMKKLASIILALLMVLLIVPCYHVSAEADSPLKDKIFVGEVNDMCIAMNTEEDYIIIGRNKDGKYLKPIAGEYEGGIYFGYTTEDYEENIIEGISSLDALKAHVKENSGSYAKTSSEVETTIDCSCATSFIFFTKDGRYIDTISIAEFTNWSKDVDTDDFKGDVKVKITPIGNKSASVVIEYDFSKRPTSLGSEDLVNFTIMSKKELLDSNDESDGAIEDTMYLNRVDSEDYMDEENTTKGMTKPYSISRNDDYVLLMKTTRDEYKEEFSIKNITTDTPSTGKAVSNGKAPRVTFSKLPKSIDTGRELKITMYTDKKSSMVFNGESTEKGKYQTEKTFTVYENGTYPYSAKAKDGGIKSGTLEVTCFKDFTATKLNMDSYYGDGTTNHMLPQTGMNINIGWLLFSFISVIMGVLILFRSKLRTATVSMKKGIKKLFTHFLVLVLMITSVLSNFTSKDTTITVKATSSDGTGGTSIKGGYTGGNWATSQCVGFGMKFSLRNRSDLVTRHSAKKENVIYNTLYEEGDGELYCTASFNSEGELTWSGDRFSMIFLDGKRVKRDKRFAGISEKHFKDLFDIAPDAFSKVIKKSCKKNNPHSLEAKDFSDVCDKYFTEEKRLYTNKGRENFYKNFVALLKGEKDINAKLVKSWQENVMSKEDFLKDGVLVVEPYAIFEEFNPKTKGDVVGITYTAAAKMHKMDSVTHSQWQAYIGSYKHILNTSSGDVGILSCGGYVNGHGSKGCNYSPKTGDYVSHFPCCGKNRCKECRDWKWKKTYSKTSQEDGNLKYGWGMYGKPDDAPINKEKRSAINVSIKMTYDKDGEYKIGKTGSQVSTFRFEDVYPKLDKMTSEVVADKDYCGRQALGSDNKKAHVLNLKDTQSEYYSGYKMTSYGAYTVTGEDVYTYSDLDEMLHGSEEDKISPILPNKSKVVGNPITGSNLNMGVSYKPQYTVRNSDYYNNPQETARLLARNFSNSSNKVERITDGKPNESETATQAKIAYNVLGLANNKSLVNKIIKSDSKLKSATTNEDKPDMGISIQYLYKGKTITSYISYAKLKYDESWNPSITLGANDSVSYDISESGKFTADKKKMYIVAVPNGGSNEGAGFLLSGHKEWIWNDLVGYARSKSGALQLSDFKSYVENKTKRKSVLGRVRYGKTTIGVGTEKDKGYSIYALEIELPKNVPVESVLNLQDYQLNMIYPRTFLVEGEDGEYKNSDTITEVITGSGYEVLDLDHTVDENHSNWYYCSRTYTTYPDMSKDIRLYHKSGTHGKTVDKANNDVWNILYNRDIGDYGVYDIIKKGNLTTESTNPNLTLDYAFNLTRGVHGDRRTISSLSSNSCMLERNFLRDNLDMDYGVAPVVVNNGKLKVDTNNSPDVRDSWARYYDEVGDEIHYSAEWVQGGDSPKAKTETSKSHSVLVQHGYWETYTDTDFKGNEVIRQIWHEPVYDDCNYVHTELYTIDKRPLYLKMSNAYAYDVTNKIHEKIFKYCTGIISSSKGTNRVGGPITYANEKGLPVSIKLNGGMPSSNNRINPKSMLDEDNSTSRIKDDECYRTAVVSTEDFNLMYYPEVRMKAYITRSNAIDSGTITPKTILTMAEKLRKTEASSLYLIRVTQPDSGNQLEGTVYSDTMGTGTNVDELSRDNGDKPVIYGGSDITLKAKGKFNINMYGYALDIVNYDKDKNGLKYGETAGGSPILQPYNTIVNDTSTAYRDPYHTWGNTDSTAKLRSRYDKWVESVKKSLNVDMTLKVSSSAGDKKLFNDFSASLGKPLGGTTTEDGVYNIYIRRGAIDKETAMYKGLINQIAKDYNCTYEEADTLFEKSDIYKSIIRSIEHSNSDINDSQVVEDVHNRVRDEEFDSPWYDEEVKVFVIRRYKTSGVTLPGIILNDKLDYGLTPDSSRGSDSSFNAQQDEYYGYEGKWYMTLFFDKNILTDSDINLYIPNPDLYNPAKGRVDESRNYYKYSTVLVNELYVSGADFIIPNATTSDIVR